MFLRGLVRTTALVTYGGTSHQTSRHPRLTFLLGALSTALMASDLSSELKSVLAILGWGKFQPILVELGFLQVPYRPSEGGEVTMCALQTGGKLQSRTVSNFLLHKGQKHGPIEVNHQDKETLTRQPTDQVS